MQVSELMSRNVRITNPEQTLQQAAQMMAEIDCGFLPVAADDRMVGMITDRDIAVRGVGQGFGPDTPVERVMTHDVKYCYEDDDIDQVASNMGDVQLRRMPVLNRDKRLVGILSLGDIAIDHHAAHAAETALSGISRHNPQLPH